MPPPRKPLAVQVPPWVADEISDAARRTQRSVAFIARKALAAGHGAPAADSPEQVELVLSVDDDDPADIAAKIKHMAGDKPLGEALAGAWAASRARFHAWIAREEDARSLERADDLDTGLATAAAPGTSAEELDRLARSEYPRIRALVALHPAASPETLTLLAGDRERTVRAAVHENPKTPVDVRARIKV